MTTIIPTDNGRYWLSGHRRDDIVTYNIQHDGTDFGDYKLEVLLYWGTWGQAYKRLLPIVGATTATNLLRSVAS